MSSTAGVTRYQLLKEKIEYLSEAKRGNCSVLLKESLLTWVSSQMHLQYE